MLSRLRQQGGAMILTVPNAIVAQMGWRVGNSLNLEMQGDNVVLTPVKRPARGRKNLEQLLAGIDSQEIVELNMSVADMVNSSPQGKEVW